MHTKPQTRQRREQRWNGKTLELPITQENIDNETYPQATIVNSGLRGYESTLTKEFNVKGSDVPVAPGSWVTDYDGLLLTINKLTAACINAKQRLEWSGDTIRALEMALWEKETYIADLTGHERPPQLPKVPFFEYHTNPEMIVVSKSVVNRAGMILVGLLSGGACLAMLWYLIFA
jgi:hypothetical protein